MFYNGYILPISDYCSIVRGTCSHSDLQRLIRMQKTATRIILSAGYHQRSHAIFNVLNIDGLDVRIRKKRLTMVYKSLNELALTYMEEMFTFNRNTHSHSLRSTTENKLYLSGGKTEYHRKKFSYLAAKEWNELPMELRNVTSLNIFKRQLHNLMSNA